MHRQEARTWAALVAFVGLTLLWQGQWLEDRFGRTLGLGVVLMPIALLCTALVIAELRRAAVSDLVGRCLEDPRRAFALTVLVLLAAIKVYAVPGLRELDGDGVSHATAVHLVADTLRAGEPLAWANAWAMGFPFLQFYPPVFAWLGGALELVVGDPGVAVRWVLAAAHFVSGIGAFVLARSLTGRPGAAMACAIAFALSPWHLFQVFHWNRFPAALTWALLPWVLWLFERGLAGRRWRAAMALLLAFAALAHHGYALFVALFLVIYALARVAGLPEGRVARLSELAAVGAAAFGLSAPFLVGYVLEGGLTFRPPGLEGAQYAFDQPTLASVLIPLRRPVGHSGYIGLSLFVLGLGGLIHGLLRGGIGRRAAFTGFAYAWVLALGAGLFLYDWLPLARALFYGGRYLMFLVLFLSLGVAFAWEELETRWRIRAPDQVGRVAMVVLLVLLVDLGGTTFTRYRHAFPGGEDRELAYRALGDPAQPDLARRALELPSTPRGFLHTGLLPLAAGRGTPAPGLWGTLHSVMYGFRSWVEVTRSFERTGVLDEAALTRLALMGVGTVLAPVDWARQSGVLPEHRGEVHEHPGKRVRIELDSGAGFVVAAPSWVPMRPDLELPTSGWQLAPFDTDSDPPGAVGRLIDTMEVDLDTGVARRLVIRHPSRFEGRRDRRAQPPGSGGATTAGELPRLVVEEVQVTPTTVRVLARTDRPALLRIAQSYYRYQEVRRNGERVPSWPSAAHAIVLSVPAGEHRIEIRALRSPLRRAVAVAGLLLVVSLALGPRLLAHRRRAAA